MRKSLQNEHHAAEILTGFEKFIFKNEPDFFQNEEVKEFLHKDENSINLIKFLAKIGTKEDKLSP